MPDNALVSRGKEIIEELAIIARQLSDAEFVELFGTGSLDNLLRSMLDPAEASNYKILNEFLLANKARSSLIAGLRRVITHNYALRGSTLSGNNVVLSPYHAQWIDDGVLFLQSEKPFEGLLGLYRSDGSLSYAIMARDIRTGETLEPNDFAFIDEMTFVKRAEQLSEVQRAALDEPIPKLEALLNAQDNDESHYQELLIKYPWLLGAEYKQIQRHTKLDDQNIPDFTGIRSHDDYRDIVEIKPPFTNMFRSDGGFTADFNDALEQAERYLEFADRNADYLLRNKGLRFEAPKCYLLVGFGLGENELVRFRRKERMNPRIQLRTYNDLLAYAKNTVMLLKAVENQEQGRKGKATDS